MITSRLGLLLPASLLFILLLPGCKEPAGDDFIEGLLTIDLTIYYQDDSVRVTLDNSLLYAQVVTTNDIWSVAKRTQLQIEFGTHHLKVSLVDKGVFAETTFEMEDTLSIAVAYNALDNVLDFAICSCLILPD